MLLTSSSIFFVKAFQFVLSLSILVFIHEMGHLLFAKLFKVRVEKFYLFFNPTFSLFRMKKFNDKWHFAFFKKNITTDDEWGKHPENTEWGIGWLPLGGYCSIAGMVDETKDEKQLTNTFQPWEFRSQNVWKRLCIIAGGITFNFITALLIFGLIIHHWGVQRVPLQNAKQGIYFAEPFIELGFEQQDKILTIDGIEVTSLSDAFNRILIDGECQVTVVRHDTDTLIIHVPSDFSSKVLSYQRVFDKEERDHQRNDPSYQPLNCVLMTEFFPFVVSNVISNGVADNAGMLPGDSVIAINQTPTPAFYDVAYELKKHPCDSITVSYYRNDELCQTRIFISDRCKLDVEAKSKFSYIEIEEQHYGFAQSLILGVERGVEVLSNYVKQLKLIFTKEGVRSVGGFGAMGSLFPSAWNSYQFWSMTALLSLILAFMNFLPIPALDGGYILFILIEIIFRIKINDKYLAIANSVGMWLLLLLFIYANINDISKLFF